MSHPTDSMIWCPMCEKRIQLVRVIHAAKMVDVHTRTIYRYIDEGLVYSLKVVGKTYRICPECLYRQSGNPLTYTC